MKVIYNGGYNAPLINGMKPVNCGAHIEVKGKIFEAMSKEYSGHVYNGVSLYISTPNENYEKVEISLFLLEDNNYTQVHMNIAYYHQKNSIHPYRRTDVIASKWDSYKYILNEAHKAIFNGSLN